MYHSMSGQDKWVLETLNFKTNGFFVDLGALGGVINNNTYTMEKEYGWNGICVDNSLDHWNSLVTARTSNNFYTTIYNYNGQCLINENGKIITDEFVTGTTVDCVTFDDIMTQDGYTGLIDYLSVNLGGREEEVILSIDLNKYEFQLISVQINKHKTPHKYVDDTFLYLWNNGYERMIVGALGQDPTRDSYCNPYEDWYFNKKYISI